MAPLWQGLYWSQGSVESVDGSGEMWTGNVFGRDSPLVVSCKPPDAVVLGLVSPLLVMSVSSEAHVTDKISSLAVSSGACVAKVVGVVSPLDVKVKSPDVLGWVRTSPLAVWLTTPEAVVSDVSAAAVRDSVLTSPVAVSLTAVSWHSVPEKPRGHKQASSLVLSSR